MLSSLAATGDVVAITLQGRVKERGYDGGGKDIAIAKSAYLTVGSRFVLAQTFLGEIYVRRNHFSIAEPLFQSAAELNETRAMVDLAMIFVHGHRPVEAKHLLKAAAVQNSCRAMHRMALLYLRGVGGANAKHELAKSLLQQAARIGYPPAIRLLEQVQTLAVSRSSTNVFGWSRSCKRFEIS